MNFCILELSEEKPEILCSYLPCKVFNHGERFSADDGDMFMNDCNMCVCFAGELTCTKMHCPAALLSPEYNASKSRSEREK